MSCPGAVHPRKCVAVGTEGLGVDQGALTEKSELVEVVKSKNRLGTLNLSLKTCQCVVNIQKFSHIDPAIAGFLNSYVCSVCKYEHGAIMSLEFQL